MLLVAGYGASVRWELERHTPVRADAEGLFVPADQLPGAEVGDEVVIHGGGDEGAPPAHPGAREGTIVERSGADGEAYLRIVLREV